MELEGALQCEPALQLSTENTVEDEDENLDDASGGQSATPMLSRTKGSKRRKVPISEQKSDAILTMEQNVKGGYIDVWWLFDDGGMQTLFRFKNEKHDVILKHRLISLFCAVYKKSFMYRILCGVSLIVCGVSLIVARLRAFPI